MALARRVARNLRHRERENLVAVGVYGSTARGDDRAAGTLCDLEGTVPRPHRRYFIEVARQGALGAAIWRLRYEARTIPEIARLTERVWDGLLAKARREGIRVPGLIPDVKRSERGGPSRGP